MSHPLDGKWSGIVRWRVFPTETPKKGKKVFFAAPHSLSGSLGIYDGTEWIRYKGNRKPVELGDVWVYASEVLSLYDWYDSTYSWMERLPWQDLSVDEPVIGQDIFFFVPPSGISKHTYTETPQLTSGVRWVYAFEVEAALKSDRLRQERLRD